MILRKVHCRSGREVQIRVESVVEILVRDNRSVLAEFRPRKLARPGKTELGLEEAHRDLKISPEEFDEVAAELGRTLDFCKVPPREKEEVLAAFAAHKNEVTAGYMTK